MGESPIGYSTERTAVNHRLLLYSSVGVLLEYLAAGNQTGFFTVPGYLAGFCADIKPEMGVVNKGFFIHFFNDIAGRTVRTAGRTIQKCLIAVGTFTDDR